MLDRKTHDTEIDTQLAETSHGSQFRPKVVTEQQDDRQAQSNNNSTQDRDQDVDSLIDSLRSYSNLCIEGTETEEARSSLEMQMPNIKPLTATEKWTDDNELLRSLLRANGIGPMYSARKSLIGNLLRTINPARFSNRVLVRNFLAHSIAAGFVVESGEGAFKLLSFPSSMTSIRPLISLSNGVSDELLKEVPERVTELSVTMPFILFAPKNRFPSGTNIPKGVFVQQSTRFLFLMFCSLADVQRTVAEDLPQLYDCTLVDWRKCCGQYMLSKTSADSSDKDMTTEEIVSCFHCRKDIPETEIIQLTTETFDQMETAMCCSNCYRWNDKEKQQAVDKVVALLTMMADNDDIYIARGILKKQLWLRYSAEGTTRKLADLWIEEAIASQQVVSFKKHKTKLLCLQEYLRIVREEFPPDDTDTSQAEQHVVDHIWASQSWVSRKAIIDSLKSTFPSMQTPFLRTKVFLNGHANKKFWLAKGPYGQTVGLTEQDAQASLEMMTKSLQNGDGLIPADLGSFEQHQVVEPVNIRCFDVVDASESSLGTNASVLDPFSNVKLNEDELYR